MTDLLPMIRDAATVLTAEELDAPILVGVSGGPDSLALLHALWRWAPARQVRLRAVQVDHRLRPESGAEGRAVAAFCAARGIAVSRRAVEPGTIVGGRGGVEEAARRARYALFAEEARRYGARVLALGHQADDQAETLLLHLLRGAGLAGLAGMPIIRRDGDLLDDLGYPGDRTRPAIWRPLLAARRAAIEAYCRAWSLTPSRDPSNADPAFRRNAVRQHILPVLEGFFPEATAILARDARLLADDEAWLRQETEQAWSRCAGTEADGVLLRRAAFRAEHIAGQRRLIRRAWATVRGREAVLGLGAATVEAAREAVVGGRVGARLALPGGVALLLDRDEAALGAAATIEATLRRRLALPLVAPGWEHRINGPTRLDLGDGWAIAVGEETSDERGSLRLPALGTPAGAGLTLRTWQVGDRLALPSGRGTQKVQDWFVDHRVPRYARRHLVLLAAGRRVLWIAGLVTFAPGGGTTLGGDPPGLVVRLLYNGLPQALAAGDTP